MKHLPNVLIIALVMALLFVDGVLQIDLLAGALVLFAIGMVAWTIKQYHHHHLR